MYIQVYESRSIHSEVGVPTNFFLSHGYIAVDAAAPECQMQFCPSIRAMWPLHNGIVDNHCEEYGGRKLLLSISIYEVKRLDSPGLIGVDVEDVFDAKFQSGSGPGLKDVIDLNLGEFAGFTPATEGSVGALKNVRRRGVFQSTGHSRSK